MGGSGADQATGIAVEQSGDAVITGASTSADFPTANAYQPAYGGGVAQGDAFVSELNQTGTALRYSTYLSGSGDDGGDGIALGFGGDVYVTGTTDSPNFPTRNAFQSKCVGETCAAGTFFAFVAKLDPALVGSASLIYSTYLGGSEGAVANAIAVDGRGDAFVTGGSSSKDFPTTPGGYRRRTAHQTTFVTKLGPSGSRLLYSTFFAAPNAEGDAIALDGRGDAYVTGSNNSPLDRRARRGATIIFSGAGIGVPIDPLYVLGLNPSGAKLISPVYIGGNENFTQGPAIGQAIAVGPGNYVYVAASPSSTDFPTTSRAFQHRTRASGTAQNAVIFRLSLSARSTPARGCIVSQLTGRTLASARSALRAAGCRAGRIFRRRAEHRLNGRILSQGARPGLRRKPGFKVNLTVGSWQHNHASNDCNDTSTGELCGAAVPSMVMVVSGVGAGGLTVER